MRDEFMHSYLTACGFKPHFVPHAVMPETIVQFRKLRAYLDRNPSKFTVKLLSDADRVMNRLARAIANFNPKGDPSVKRRYVHRLRHATAYRNAVWLVLEDTEPGVVTAKRRVRRPLGVSGRRSARLYQLRNAKRYEPMLVLEYERVREIAEQAETDWMVVRHTYESISDDIEIERARRRAKDPNARAPRGSAAKLEAAKVEVKRASQVRVRRAQESASLFKRLAQLRAKIARLTDEVAELEIKSL